MCLVHLMQRTLQCAMYRAGCAGGPRGLAKRVIACLDVRTNDTGDLVVTKGDQYDVREKAGGQDVRNFCSDQRELNETYRSRRSHKQQSGQKHTTSQLASACRNLRFIELANNANSCGLNSRAERDRKRDEERERERESEAYTTHTAADDD